MPQEHPWTRITHHAPNLIAHFWLVTVYWATGASGLALLKWALIQAQERIRAQRVAIRTQFFAAGLVIVPAIHTDHDQDRFAFSTEAGRINSVQNDSCNKIILVLLYQRIIQSALTVCPSSGKIQVPGSLYPSTWRILDRKGLNHESTVVEGCLQVGPRWRC